VPGVSGLRIHDRLLIHLRCAESYLLKNDEWKYDVIPEIQDGKNVADFIDPDIIAKLDELEAEEERLEAAGFYDSESEVDSEEEAIRTAASTIRDKKHLIRLKNQEKNKHQNKAVIPRKDQTRTLSEMTARLKESGYDPSSLEERATMLAKARGLVGRKRGAEDDDDEMDEDEDFGGFGSEDDDEEGMEVEEDGSRQASKKRRTSTSGSIVPRGKRVPTSNRATANIGGDVKEEKAKQLRMLAQRAPNSKARAGEGDRHETASIPKWLFSGKRKVSCLNRSRAWSGHVLTLFPLLTRRVARPTDDRCACRMASLFFTFPPCCSLAAPFYLVHLSRLYTSFPFLCMPMHRFPVTLASVSFTAIGFSFSSLFAAVRLAPSGHFHRPPSHSLVMSASPTRRTASPDVDPGARWQQIREEWLARPAPPSNKSAVIENDDAASASKPAGMPTAEQAKTKTKRGRDPVFQQRIATLEQLLREANALATGTSPAKLSIAQPRPPDIDTAVVPSLVQTGSAGNAALNGQQQQGEEPEEEEEPDGGMPIRDHAAQGDPTHELKKVSEVCFALC
jgi:hypothetical protein